MGKLEEKNSFYQFSIDMNSSLDTSDKLNLCCSNLLGELGYHQEVYYVEEEGH